jgi:hypothetical protein
LSNNERRLLALLGGPRRFSALTRKPLKSLILAGGLGRSLGGSSVARKPLITLRSAVPRRFSSGYPHTPRALERLSRERRLGFCLPSRAKPKPPSAAGKVGETRDTLSFSPRLALFTLAGFFFHRRCC